VPEVANPPLTRFLVETGAERVWAQVLIRRRNAGFELRHEADREVADSALRTLAVARLRALADFTAQGSFRPLKTAPNLATGWRCEVPTPADLATALHHLYPGSLPDRWALATGAEGPVGLEQAIARNPGRRGDALRSLLGRGLASVIDACCGAASCLKHRYWSAPGVALDTGTGKSMIPCLEPCPVFLSFAEACARIEQAHPVPVEFAPEDLATVVAAIRHLLGQGPGDLREGDVDAPLHPRRLARLLHRHASTWTKATAATP
jgi:hypothetical protein